MSLQPQQRQPVQIRVASSHTRNSCTNRSGPVMFVPAFVTGRFAVVAIATIVLFVLGASALAAGYTIQAAHAQPLSDATGLVNRLEIPSGSEAYEVVVTSSFDVVDYSFDVSKISLTLQTGPILSENLAEIVVPRALLSGDIRVFVDGVQQHDAVIKTSDKISFLVLRFAGSVASDDPGNTSSKEKTIEITGTQTMAIASYSLRYDPGAARDSGDVTRTDDDDGNDTDGTADKTEHTGGSCLVATVAYGSEMSEQVQWLREIRDAKIASTGHGQDFLVAFNSVYYTFSPHVADLAREHPLLQDAMRAYLSPMMLSLGIMDGVQPGSEADVLGYGVLVIMLNLGMYVAPTAAMATAVIMHARRGLF